MSWKTDEPEVRSMPLAWGAKVSREFRIRVIDLSKPLMVDPSLLMTVMAFQTDRTFSASLSSRLELNSNVGVGLIQFNPQTAQLLGTTIESLRMMTPERQLSFVQSFFWPSRGKLKTLEDIYMAILWPEGVGKPNDMVVFDRAHPFCPLAYLANHGLVFNSDGKITKSEACARVQALLPIGFLPENKA